MEQSTFESEQPWVRGTYISSEAVTNAHQLPRDKSATALAEYGTVATGRLADRLPLSTTPLILNLLVHVTTIPDHKIPHNNQ